MLAERADVLALIAEKRRIATICEGKRDVLSLEQLGFTKIIELRGPLYAVVEQFDKGEVVQLLVDLDDEGRKLYATLSSDLKQRGVHIDNELRELLFKTPVRHIEGLAGWLSV